jgi:capsule polysaccharide export protein KpsE/RkpR
LAQLERDTYVQEGIDALTLLTPLLENRRRIVLGVILIAGAVGAWSLMRPRKYKAELSITPVTSNRSGQALGNLAALTGAALQTGYTLTPQRMVELLRSRAVLAGVGLSTTSSAQQRVVDRMLGERYKNDDAESVARQLSRIITVGSNKETGTVTLAVAHKDSALARLIASRVVDSASQIFVRTARAQATQLRLAQEARVANAANQLSTAEERLREFNFANRAAPPFSVQGIERDRLARQIRFAEQAYTQAMTERETAFARELEATPTVVVQDPLPITLPKVRKRVIMKTVVAAVVSAVMISLLVLLTDVIRRRLQRQDTESERFRGALATLPSLRRKGSRVS